MAITPINGSAVVTAALGNPSVRGPKGVGLPPGPPVKVPTIPGSFGRPKPVKATPKAARTAAQVMQKALKA